MVPQKRGVRGLVKRRATVPRLANSSGETQGHMKPAPFTYHDPKTAAEAAELLGKLENARVLAGGQSLVPMMNFRYVMPDHIVDINGIGVLAYVRNGGGTLSFGALTRQREIEFSDEVIEQRQRDIAKAHNIRLTNHSLYLYGHCANGDCKHDD